jgi:hypothetical protein
MFLASLFLASLHPPLTVLGVAIEKKSLSRTFGAAVGLFPTE